MSMYFYLFIFDFCLFVICCRLNLIAVHSVYDKTERCKINLQLVFCLFVISLHSHRIILFFNLSSHMHRYTLRGDWFFSKGVLDVSSFRVFFFVCVRSSTTFSSTNCTVDFASFVWQYQKFEKCRSTQSWHQVNQPIIDCLNEILSFLEPKISFGFLRFSNTSSLIFIIRIQDFEFSSQHSRIV